MLQVPLVATLLSSLSEADRSTNHGDHHHGSPAKIKEVKNKKIEITIHVSAFSDLWASV
jgi:hypothetical protein